MSHPSRQAASQHIDVLVDAGLVETQREGRYRFHHDALAVAWTRSEVEVQWTTPWGDTRRDWVTAGHVRRR